MITKKLLKIKISLISFIVIVSITTANVLLCYLYIPGPLKKQTNIIIEHGISVEDIARKLNDNDIIYTSKLFELICKLYSLYTPLKSGEYELTARISPLQIIRKLAVGKSIIHRLIIPEGMTVNEIIDKINEEKLLEGSISLPIPEGYLMPSTYFYSYGDKRENIIDKMRVKMSDALNMVMLKLPSSSPLKSRKEVLILASIIEKEAANNEEKARIAAVFINRLKKNMKLQADPTSAYAITQGKYRLKRPLTRSDLKYASPYNTYYIHGLPVGPISCPGTRALEAAINPLKTDELYFVVNGYGGHNFSKTLKEHIMHVQNFKKLTSKD